MLKVKELKEFATDPFLNEFKPALDKMNKIIKNDGSHIDLYNTINEAIGCLNKYKHNIKEFASYSDDENDYFNLGN